MGNSYLPEKAAKGQVKKETLYELYVTKGLTMRQCAKELGLKTHGGISWHLRKFGISARSKHFVVNKNTNHRPKNMVEVECSGCGKKLSRFPSHVVENNFCSIECKKAQAIKKYIGRKFGLLTVVEYMCHNKHNHPTFACDCECGGSKVVQGCDLSSNRVVSCGCQNTRKGKDNPLYRQVKIKCPVCGTIFNKRPSSAYENSTCSRKCMGKWMSESRTREKSPRWKGGKDVAWFETYCLALKGFEKTRRAPDNPDLLEIRCAYCGKWFKPSRLQVTMRVDAINGKGGESRIYCSEDCKDQCPTYKKIWHQRGFKKASSREVNPLLRQMCFKRDDWTCQMCGSESKLHCHHVKSYTQNKILGNDIDNTITLCKKCHKKVHSEQGCKYYELKCVNN